MRFKWKTLLITPFFLLLLGLPVHGEPMPKDQDQQKQMVKLTKKQQAELSQLHLDILDKKKQLIIKYVQYGVIPKEKGDKILQRLNEHYNEIKQNGSVPHYGMHHHHYDHHHGE